MAGKIFVETERFLLREITEADVSGIVALDTDPEVHRYLGNQLISNEQEALDSIAYIRQQYKDNGIGRWGIISKADGAFVGWTGLKLEKIVRPYHYYDLGYRLRPEYWRQGIATETAKASLEYGFTVMGLSEICAAAHIDNAGSNKVLLRMGMQATETFEYDGDPHNWYILPKAEWVKNPPS